MALKSIQVILLTVSLFSLKYLTEAQFTQDPRCPPWNSNGSSVYLPYPGDCTKFLECSDGVAIELDCPPGLWWHQEIEDCDWPSTDFCNDDDTTSKPVTSPPTQRPSTQPITTQPPTTQPPTTQPPTTQPPTTQPPTTQPPTTQPPTTQPPTTQPPTTQPPTTQPPTTQPPTTQPPTTQPPTTQPPTTQPPTTQPPTTQPTTTTGENEDPRCVGNATSYWPHPEFCHRYIECYQGNSYEMVCPPSLYFSPAHQECVDATESECCDSGDCINN